MIDKRPAIAHGGPYQEGDNAPTTLSQTLKRAIHLQPVKGIIYLYSDGSEFYQSYAKLCEEAERILAGLHTLGFQPGDKVLLQVEENYDYLSTFWACVLGGMIAIPFPIASSYQYPNITATLLQQVWEFCDHPYVIASSTLVAALHTFVKERGLEGLKVAIVNDLRMSPPPGVRQWHNAQPDDVAVIIFTSGSTGIPKGVPLTHRNIISYMRGFTQHMDLSKQDITFHWLPLVHAMGLIICHLRDVYLGCLQIHAYPQTIISDPLTWINYLNHYHVTCSMAPNFAFSLINEYADAIPQRRWDLSSLRCLMIAGEIIVPKTVRKFLALLRPHGLSPTAIYPHYGMTEALALTISERSSLEMASYEDHLVDVGRPFPEVWVRIVDEQNQVQLEGISGHIQVKCPSMTSGYYRNPELNQQIFTSDGWLDTGDVGFLNEERLTITGRTKDIIIVNGRNYNAYEIESVVEEISEVEVSFTAACAIRDADSNTDSLAIFYSSQCTSDVRVLEQIEKIRRQVVSAVGLYPTYVLPLAKHAIPKTALGKIQRAKLKQQFETGAFNNLVESFKSKSWDNDVYAKQTASQSGEEQDIRSAWWQKEAPTQMSSSGVEFEQNAPSITSVNTVELRLVEIWRNVLQVDKVYVHDNFFALGGDSLLGIRMAAQAQRVGLNLTPQQLLQHQTIAELASVVVEMSPVNPPYMDEESRLELGDLPLTSGQSGLLSEAFDPHHFNESILLKTHAAFDALHLRQTVQYLIKYHDALRLRFTKDEHGWRQFFSLPDEEPPVMWIDLSEVDEDEQKSVIEQWATRLQTSLNLFTGPIMQIAYFNLGVQKPGRLLWIINDTIVDFYSVDLLLEDFQIVYQQITRGEKIYLPPVATSLKQWGEHLKAYVQSPEMEHELETYWLNLPWDKVVSLPTDYPKRNESTLSIMRALNVSLSSDETTVLLEQHNAQIVDILLTFLVQTFAQWIGSPWVLISVLDTGRNVVFDNIDLSLTLGYIAYARRNLLEQRSSTTLQQALHTIQEQLVAVPHGGMGFDLLYHLSKHKEKLKRVPPPHVKLNYLSRINQRNYNNSFFTPADENSGPDRDPQERRNSFSSIVVMGAVLNNQLILRWEYDKTIYKHTTINKLAGKTLEYIREYINNSTK